MYKDENIEIVYRLSLLGLTEDEMSGVFGISRRTFNSWKRKYPEFQKALQQGMFFADGEVAESLYRRACGDEKKLPDTSACIFWLKNRQPDKWRDKRDVVDKPDEAVRKAYLDSISRMGKDS